MFSNKRYEALLAGFDKLASRVKALDLDSEEAPETLQRIAAAAKTAREIATKERDLATAPQDEALREALTPWLSLITGFEMMHTKTKLLGLEVSRRQKLSGQQARIAAEGSLQAARAAEQAQVEVVDGEVRTSTPERTLDVLRKARATLDALPEPQDTVKTTRGSLFARKNWRWRVVNAELIPDRYCQRQVVTERIDMAVRGGVRDIPGVEVYEEESAVVRRA